VIEEILERWAKEINHEDIVQALLAKVVDIRDTSCVFVVSHKQSYSRLGILTTSDQDLVCPILITQLRSIALPWFLHRDLSATAPTARM
jgi:hypothetical protein